MKTECNDERNRWMIFTFILMVLLLCAQDAAAAATTLGKMASQITKSFSNIAKLISGGSYLAGLGFSIGAIMKFKQHKDNPTQIPIGTPIALVFIAAALLFLPSILDVAGGTMFGGGAKVGGPKGMIYTAPGGGSGGGGS